MIHNCMWNGSAAGLQRLTQSPNAGQLFTAVIDENFGFGARIR